VDPAGHGRAVAAPRLLPLEHGRFDEAAVAVNLVREAYREIGLDADDPWFDETMEAIGRREVDTHEHPIWSDGDDKEKVRRTGRSVVGYLETTQPLRTNGSTWRLSSCSWGDLPQANQKRRCGPALRSVNATQRHPTHSGDRATMQWTVRGRFRWLLLTYTSNLRRCIVSTSSRGARWSR
jgi:hypothetical protein